MTAEPPREDIRSARAALLERVDILLRDARSGPGNVPLSELEDVYTSGCAKVLELEADAMRSKRRLRELRDELRHVRAAIEFLQDEQAASDGVQ
jgi:hypothetical protein